MEAQADIGKAALSVATSRPYGECTFTPPTAVGLGRDLLQAVVGDLRKLVGIERILIGVTAGNTAAEALYASYGFVAYGTEPGAIKVDGNDYDEVLMQLTF